MTIVSLFGNVGEKLANVTEAAIRQYIGTTAVPQRIRVYRHRQKILKLLRTSSDGFKQIRGVQDQKVRAYGLRHIVWMLAIEIDL